MKLFQFGDKDQERSYLELMFAIRENDGVECAQVPDIFFPDDWAVSKGTDIALAKQICERCPVKMKCFEYAMTAEDEQGIWAGTTQHERRQIRALGRN